MWRSFSKRMSVTAAVASMAALAVSAVLLCGCRSTSIPAGVACTFGLQVDAAGGDHRVERTFVDADGNPVRILSAGRGSQLTFTNARTGATYRLARERSRHEAP